MALLNCKADILGIADDDLYYYDNFEKIILKMHEENKGKVKRIGRTYHLMPDHKHLDGICDMCVINNCENCRIDEIRTKYRITRKSTGTEENGF